ncbi:F-box/LRR-repeat protein [Trifolium repens]|nr:F-box/LRR-repeat protein [Trifolium repens]
MACRRKRTAVSDLPDNCWDLVLTELMNKCDDKEERNHYLETLSLVSKQLLSITNQFVYSFKLISNPSSSPISRLFNRFPNLTSLDLSAFRQGGDLNALLSRIPPRSFSNITSLNLSNHPTFPTLGLRSIIIPNNNRLTSLICSNIASLKFTDITFIADSFPFLQHLDLSFPGGGGVSDGRDYDNAMNLLAQKLSKLRSVHLSGNFYIDNSSFLQLCINCEFLQEVLISRCPFITHAGIAEAIHHRPTLNSLSVTNFKEGLELENVDSYFIDSLTCLKHLTCLDFSFSCITDLMFKAIALEALPLTKLVLQDSYNYTYSGISYLLSNCPSLQHLDLQGANFLNDQLFNQLCAFLPDIRMESTDIGLGPTPSVVVDLVVYPQLKSLHLAYNSHLQDNLINIFAFIFPNMQLIDFSFCPHVFQHRIALLLKKCPKIAHLKFAGFPHAKLSSINFEASNRMEVLNLSHSRIDDEGLYQISKICPQLMQLDLEHCYYVTEKGVRLAIENCTRLREINLQHCRKVSTDIVSWMIFSRPSLRKITAPPHFRPRDCDRKLLFERCLVF